MDGATIKSTINLNKYCKEQLEYFVQIKEIGSITEGINFAIEQYVKAKQKELYASKMKQAKSDKDFIKRTMDTQKEFEKSDKDTENQISKEEYEW